MDKAEGSYGSSKYSGHPQQDPTPNASSLVSEAFRAVPQGFLPLYSRRAWDWPRHSALGRRVILGSSSWCVNILDVFEHDLDSQGKYLACRYPYFFAHDR